MNYDTFLRKPDTIKIGKNDGKTNVNAPSNPTLSVSVANGGKYVTSEAGDYFYAVRAVNKYGKSDVIQSAAAATIVAGSCVDLQITVGAGNNTSYYEVLRGSKNQPNTGDLEFLFSVSLAEANTGYDGGGVGKVRDNYRFMAGTEQAFICENREDVMSFKQLAPLMKMDLAVTSPAYRFMILHYGTPMLYAPRKFIRFINVGNAQ
jgi:hypothetical protein